jgi:hypothetical protein
MDEMRSPHDRSANNHHFSDDRGAINDPAFDYRLDHAVDDRPFYDGLHNVPLDNATLDHRLNDVTLDDATLHARLFIVILDLEPAFSGSIVERIIIVQRIASPELCGGRSGYGSGRIGEGRNTAYGKCFQKRT